MPVMRKYYELHGAGRVPIPKTPLGYRGGIFGGPPLPIERSGMFVDHWALPQGMWHDNTIGGPLPYLGNNLADRIIRTSGQPVVGLAGLGQPVALGDVGGLVLPAIIGGVLGFLFAAKSKKPKGAMWGAVLGGASAFGAGRALGSNLISNVVLPAAGGMVAGKYVAGKK